MQQPRWPWNWRLGQIQIRNCARCCGMKNTRISKTEIVIKTCIILYFSKEIDFGLSVLLSSLGPKQLYVPAILSGNVVLRMRLMVTTAGLVCTCFSTLRSYRSEWHVFNFLEMQWTVFYPMASLKLRINAFAFSGIAGSSNCSKHLINNKLKVLSICQRH